MATAASAVGKRARARVCAKDLCASLALLMSVVAIFAALQSAPADERAAKTRSEAIRASLNFGRRVTTINEHKRANCEYKRAHGQKHSNCYKKQASKSYVKCVRARALLTVAGGVRVAFESAAPPFAPPPPLAASSSTEIGEFEAALPLCTLT